MHSFNTDQTCWKFPNGSWGYEDSNTVFSEKVHHTWGNVEECVNNDPYASPKESVIYIKFDEPKHLRTMLLMTEPGPEPDTPSEVVGNSDYIKVYVGTGYADLKNWPT